MKKLTITLFFATFATAIFSQTWVSGTDGFTLSPSSANLAIGNSIRPDSKLRIYQGDNTTTGTLYGLYLSSSVDNANSTGNLYGVYLTTLKANTNSSGNMYGVYSITTNYGQSGTLYGSFSSTNNYNPANAGAVYGTYTAATSSNTTGYVYGVHSTASGGDVNKRYSGYFTGGKFIVANGNVGIGTATPKTIFDVGTTRGLSVSAANIDPAFNYDLTFLKNTGRLLLAWNRSGGDGEQNFVSNCGAGSKGGFAFYDYNNSGVMSHLMTIIGTTGNVGIGTTNPTAKLDVIGIVRAYEVKVCLNQGCDFVFDKDYKLMPLNDLSSFISENKHLPEIAPAAVMESEGINLSEMNAKLLQKVEELTLYVIDLQKQIDELKK